MKFGIIVTDDDTLWGGEEGVGEFVLKRFEERNSNRDTFHVFYAVSGRLPAQEDIITFDGFLLTGSHFSVNEELPWMLRLEHFVRVVYQTSLEFGRPRLVGICFGHQLIAKALGGTVGSNPEEKFHFGSCKVMVEEDFLNKDFTVNHFGRRNSSEINLMKFHGECVTEAPKTAQVIGYSSQCKHEILLYGDSILSTQGHPEYTKDTMTQTNHKIMKRIGKLDAYEMGDSIDKIDESDADGCTEMVRSFLRHAHEEDISYKTTDQNNNSSKSNCNAKSRRAMFHRMQTFQ